MEQRSESKSSVTVKTTAKGQKQVDVKVYEGSPIEGLAKEAVVLMNQVERELQDAHYQLAGS